MTSITVSDRLTIIYVLVDDWYQAKGVQLLKGKPGAKPEFSDSEVITLLLVMEFIPFPSETQFLGFVRANYLTLFPRLLDQSQFNRRARALRLLVEELRRSWLVELGVFITPASCWIPSPGRWWPSSAVTARVTSPGVPVMSTVPAGA